MPQAIIAAAATAAAATAAATAATAAAAVAEGGGKGDEGIGTPAGLRLELVVWQTAERLTGGVVAL